MKTKKATILKRSDAELTADRLSDHGSVLMTRHGNPATDFVSVDSPGFLQKQIALMAGIARGERDLAEGRVCSDGEAEKRMARWLNWINVPTTPA